MFSQSEVSYASWPILENGEADSVRADARRPFDYRDVVLSLDCSSSALGSAQCVIGDGSQKTVVTAATRAEIEQIENQSDAGKIVVALECAPAATSSLKADTPTHLSTLLTTLFSSLPKECLSQLVILPRSKAWTIYVDVLVQSADGGDVIDMAVLAARSALATTHLPSTRPVTYAGQDEGETAAGGQAGAEEGIGGLVKAGKAGSKAIDFELVDSAQKGARLQGATDLPVAVTFTLIGQKPIVDATLLEEAASTASITVAMNGQGNIVGVEQLGQGEVDFMTVKSILKGSPDVLRLLLQAANDRISLAD